MGAGNGTGGAPGGIAMVGWLARVWNSYSMSRVEISHVLYRERNAGQAKNSKIQIANSKSRVTIHDTIQIQLLLFKFVALFKMSGTIQIPNMNSARALQLSGSGTQIHLLFGALCRALLVIMQIIWFLIMQYGCAMLFNDNDLRGWWI